MVHIPPQKPCPYCGSAGVIAVLPKTDLIKKINVKGEAPDIASAESAVEMWQNPYPRTHSYCGSCQKSYSLTSLTPDYIIQNARTYDESKIQRIADLIEYFYRSQEMTLTALITNHCVGIVNPYRTKIPYITNNFLRKKLHVCFNVNNQRTYLVLTKKKTAINGNNFEYYDYESMVMSV